MEDGVAYAAGERSVLVLLREVEVGTYPLAPVTRTESVEVVMGKGKDMVVRVNGGERAQGDGNFELSCRLGQVLALCDAEGKFVRRDVDDF